VKGDTVVQPLGKKREHIMAGGEFGFVDLIIRDHNEVKQLMQKFQNTQDHNEKKNYSTSLIESLCKHSFAEEQLLYPILKNVLKHQEDSEKSMQEHNQVCETHHSYSF
jgi:hemerythrin superfamily protein